MKFKLTVDQCDDIAREMDDRLGGLENSYEDGSFVMYEYEFGNVSVDRKTGAVVINEFNEE